MEGNQKIKLINWIKFCYKTYDLNIAHKEVYMFLKRCEACSLISSLECDELLEYSEGKLKLGEELVQMEKDLKESGVI